MRLIMIVLCLFSLCACNTISGIGRDIEAGGNAVSGTAEKTKRNM